MAKKYITDPEHTNLNMKISHLEEKLTLQMNNNQRIQLIQVNSEFEVVNMRLDKIEKIDTRLKVVEGKISFIDDFGKYKKLVIFALISFIGLSNFEHVKDWLIKTILWFK